MAKKKKFKMPKVHKWAYIALLVVAIYYSLTHYFLFVQYPIQQWVFQWGMRIGSTFWIALEPVRFAIALYIFRWFLK